MLEIVKARAGIKVAPFRALTRIDCHCFFSCFLFAEMEIAPSRALTHLSCHDLVFVVLVYWHISQSISGMDTKKHAQKERRMPLFLDLFKFILDFSDQNDIY